jgi:hypothetical protein
LNEQRASIALCIPTLGPPTWALFDSFGQWQSYHYATHPDLPVTVIRPPRPLPVDVARSYLVQQVLEGDYSHLWFTDQDAAYTPNTLERLMAWDVDIVGALCMMREPEACRPMVFTEPREPGSEFYRIPINEIYQYLKAHADITTNAPQAIDPIPEGSLFPCTFTGCHCLLIKRAVLEALEAPWFSGKPGQEDRYFCFKAGQAGFQVHVDFSTIVGHVVSERCIGAFDCIAHTLYIELSETTYERIGDSRARED